MNKVYASDNSGRYVVPAEPGDEPDILVIDEFEEDDFAEHGPRQRRSRTSRRRTRRRARP